MEAKKAKLMSIMEEKYPNACRLHSYCENDDGDIFLSLFDGYYCVMPVLHYEDIDVLCDRLQNMSHGITEVLDRLEDIYHNRPQMSQEVINAYPDLAKTYPNIFRWCHLRENNRMLYVGHKAILDLCNLKYYSVNKKVWSLLEQYLAEESARLDT